MGPPCHRAERRWPGGPVARRQPCRPRTSARGITLDAHTIIPQNGQGALFCAASASSAYHPVRQHRLPLGLRECVRDEASQFSPLVQWGPTLRPPASSCVVCALAVESPTGAASLALLRYDVSGHLWGVCGGYLPVPWSPTSHLPPQWQPDKVALLARTPRAGNTAKSADISQVPSERHCRATPRAHEGPRGAPPPSTCTPAGQAYKYAPRPPSFGGRHTPAPHHSNHHHTRPRRTHNSPSPGPSSVLHWPTGAGCRSPLVCRLAHVFPQPWCSSSRPCWLLRPPWCC